MATLKKSVSVLTLVVFTAFLFTFTIGCDDGDDGVVIVPITVTETALAGTWTKDEAAGKKYRTYATDFSFLEFVIVDSTVTSRVSGAWSVNGNDITLTIAGADIVYASGINGTTLTMNAGIEEVWTSTTFPDTTFGKIPDDSKVVIFDDFGIHKFGTDDADTGYTNLTSVGHQLADYLATDNPGYPGGSEWYAYVSNNGARIYVYDDQANPNIIVDSVTKSSDAADGTGFNQNVGTVMEKMQGDDSLTVVFDCKDENIDKNKLSYYYAGIGVSIGGVKDSLGAVLTPLAEVEGDAVYWDFSGIESFTIKGTIQGSIKMFFEYKVDKTNPELANGVWGYHGVSLAGDIDNPSVFDTTVKIADLVPGAGTPIQKAGISFDDAKAAISAFVIELDTEASVGGDFAIVKLDDIQFNFTTPEAKSDALPWIE